MALGDIGVGLPPDAVWITVRHQRPLPLSVGMIDDVYRRLRDERRSGGGILCSEIQPLKCRDFALPVQPRQLGIEHDQYRRDIPDIIDSIGRGSHSASHRAEYRFYRHHFLADSEPKCHPSTHRTQADGGREAKKYWRVIISPMPDDACYPAWRK